VSQNGNPSHPSQNGIDTTRYTKPQSDFADLKVWRLFSSAIDFFAGRDKTRVMLKNGVKLNILGIIPARGGSKSVALKNIKKLAGRPLISYVLNAAKRSHLLTDLIVSSEDDAILAVAEKYGGGEVLLKRPDFLAKDDTPDVPVLRHAISQMESRKKIRYDLVVMLHVTTPLLRTEDIDGCIDKLITTGADSVVSVYRVTDANPIKMKKIVDDKLIPYIDGFEEDTTIRRQDLPPVYRRNAGIYASKREVVMDMGKVWGQDVRPFLMPEERSVDINGLLDFYFAEAAIKFLRSGSRQKINNHSHRATK